MYYFRLAGQWERMTGLVQDSPVSGLVLPVLLRPILSGLERQEGPATQTLRTALSKVAWLSNLPDFNR